ncbi:MAG: IclR family transcriptional regulator [Thermomicrobiales bacterium]|nr:IclR family transcriptional regulator [Thermomicrobiales bacterium]MCO5221356.1 IclR family transcriptional regulator [Thermomicrobiales bacterium]
MTMTEQQQNPPRSTPPGEASEASVVDRASGKNYVQVFGRMAAILDVLAASPRPLGLTEISRRSGTTKASAHRLLSTLAVHNYVEPGAQSGTYQLGLRLFQLGSVVQSRLDLRTRARPVMERLADETEETVFLSILRDSTALCIERIDGKHVQVLALQVGTTLPLHSGGGPRVLLAGLSDQQIDDFLQQELEPITRFTEIDPQEIWATIERIRSTGYAISEEDVTIGVAAIGAPIHGVDGSVIGTLSLAGITQRLTRSRIPLLIDQVVNAAAEISALMGYEKGETSSR